MFDIFSALLGIGAVCTLLGTITKMLLTAPKVWDEDNYTFKEIEEAPVDYNELRKQDPHIWID